MAAGEVIKAAGLSSIYVFQRANLPFLVFPCMRQRKPVFIMTRCLSRKDEADRRGVTSFLYTGAVPWQLDDARQSKAEIRQVIQVLV
jgi:hypothetical protein